MKRLGAQVLGIDASEKNINVAKIHAKKNNLNIDYKCTSPENLDTETNLMLFLIWKLLNMLKM